MELMIKNVRKDFKDVTAIAGITLTMNSGVYGLLGVNGAGKTTLMRMLCTLLKPTSGNIYYDGTDIWKLEGEYRNILGYLPQDYGYYPDFSAKDYLMYISSIKGIKPYVAKKRISQLLEQVGLTKVEDKKMKTFSGGMKRRVGIAQAMINNPQILILDEPTAGLDPNERIRFRNLISELAEERLVLLSTHIVSDVEYIANEIILMKEGRIVEKGTSKEVLNSMTTKVWKCLLQKSEVEEYSKQYKLINMKSVENGIEVRLIADEKPCDLATEEKKTLEDAFLFYFGEKAGEEHAIF